MLLHPGQSLEFGAQLEGGEDGVFARQRDVGLAGQAPESVQPVLGQPQLVKLHLVATLLTPAGKLVRLQDGLPSQQQELCARETGGYVIVKKHKNK